MAAAAAVVVASWIALAVLKNAYLVLALMFIL